MKKIIATFALIGMAALGFAQDAAAPAAPDLGKQVDTLSSKVAALDGKIKIGGYILGGITFNATDGNALSTDAFVDASSKGNKPDRFRLNFKYADDWGGVNARLDYSAYTPATKMAFAEAYLWLLPKTVKVGGGLVDNESEFAAQFVVAAGGNPTIFSGLVESKGLKTLDKMSYSSQTTFFNPIGGYYQGALGGEALVYVPFVDGLELGVFVPAGTYSGSVAATSTSDAILPSIDYNVAYKIKDIGTFKAGWNGRDVTYTTADDFSNHNSASPNVIYGANVAYGTFEFKATSMPELFALVSYENKTTKDLAQVSNIWYASAGYDFRAFGLKDLFVGEDAGAGSVNGNHATALNNVNSTSKYTDYFGVYNASVYSTNTQIKFTIRNLLPNGLNLVPNLNVKTFVETTPYKVPVLGLPLANVYSIAFEPKLQVIAPNGNLFGVGYGLYKGNTFSGDHSIYQLVSVATVINY